VCGGKLIFPRTTFILFSRVPPDAARDLDISEAFGNNSHVYFQKGNQFHLVVDEPFDRTPTNPNRVCPAVQSLRTMQNSSSPSTSSSPNTASCFPASALVTLHDGSSTRMSEVSTGSKIKDYGGLTSEVFMFTHRDGSRSLHPFLYFKTAENFTLTISPGHYIYTPDGLRPARNLHVGSILILGDDRRALVMEKFIVLREGLYNPQTMSGSLIVDGFAVSAYTTAVAPSIAHAILSPLRLLYRSSWTKSFFQRKLSHLFYSGAREIYELIPPLSGTDFVA
jgi:Hint module